MLRREDGAGFEQLGRGLRARWVFRTSRLESDRMLGRRAYRRLLAEQEERPVAVLADGTRTWWMHGGRVVSTDRELTPDDVAVLLRERERRAERRLEQAHLREAASRPEASEPRRAIARDVRQAVWVRDGGRCVACGTDFDLQYDHVIPRALGGGDAADNLQLLCGDCNRAKGAAIA